MPKKLGHLLCPEKIKTLGILQAANFGEEYLSIPISL